MHVWGCVEFRCRWEDVVRENTLSGVHSIVITDSIYNTPRRYYLLKETMASSTPSFKTIQELSRTVICVARNYVAHAKELNNKVPQGIPPIFLKPPSTIVGNGSDIIVPKGSTIDHEIELGVVIGKPGSQIPVERAGEYISGYFLGIDVTARTYQKQAAKAGMPWTVAKGNENFAVVSEILSKDKIKDNSNLRLWLKNNGTMKHDGNTRNMIFNVDELISYVSNVFPLLENDIIFTGTPEGVAPMVDGDIVEAGLEDVATGVTLIQLRNKVRDTQNPHSNQIFRTTNKSSKL